MNGATKEGLTGWDRDNPRVEQEKLHRLAIGAYRALRESGRVEEAGAVRAMVNEAVILGYRVKEAERVAAEGKGSQPWAEFVRPFAQMDASELLAWIETFKAAVVEEKSRGKN